MTFRFISPNNDAIHLKSVSSSATMSDAVAPAPGSAAAGANAGQFDDISSVGKRVLLGKPAAQQNVAAAPAISSILLLQGWKKEHTRQLAAATATIVEANPVLSGHLERSGGKMYVQPGMHRKNIFVVHEQPSTIGVQDFREAVSRLR